MTSNAVTTNDGNTIPISISEKQQSLSKLDMDILEKKKIIIQKNIQLSLHNVDMAISIQKKLYDEYRLQLDRKHDIEMNQSKKDNDEFNKSLESVNKELKETQTKLDNNKIELDNITRELEDSNNALAQKQIQMRADRETKYDRLSDLDIYILEQTKLINQKNIQLSLHNVNMTVSTQYKINDEYNQILEIQNDLRQQLLKCNTQMTETNKLIQIRDDALTVMTNKFGKCEQQIEDGNTEYQQKVFDVDNLRTHDIEQIRLQHKVMSDEFSSRLLKCNEYNQESDAESIRSIKAERKIRLYVVIGFSVILLTVFIGIITILLNK